MSPQLLLIGPTTSRDRLASSSSDRPSMGLIAANGWRVAFVRHRNMAEKLLEYLKDRGVIIREVRAIGPAAFAVRWRD